ncbi:acyltransferase family protein [Streptomyces sp. NPDC088254]|uniref:acyltransferase family protein n=1 Tax=Streptomyces sp. NPDC088254 TaxID=3365847 RepID=UPI00381736D1
MTTTHRTGQVDATTDLGGEGAAAQKTPPTQTAPASGRVIVSRSGAGGGRLAALDGLRFLAALAVVLFHFIGQKPKTMVHLWGRTPENIFPDAHPVFAFGRLGVDLFFLISGFVICMSAWGRTPRDFFISRVTRLYPMYWIGVVVSAICIKFAGAPFGSTEPRVILANLTMLQKPLGVEHLDSVYWTLWPELCFYLTFAVVVWKGLTYQRVLVFAGLWTVAAVLAPAADLPLLTLVVNPPSAPYFIAGMAFYLMYRFRPTPLLWGVVGMSWLLALHFLLTPGGGRISWNEWSPWRGWLILVITAFFFMIAAIALGWTHRIRWRWLSVAGTLTFPLYLLHSPIGLTVAYRFGDRVDPRLLIVGTVIGLVLLCYVVHRFVERPLATAMRRWLKTARFRPAKPVASSAAPSSSSAGHRQG